MIVTVDDLIKEYKKNRIIFSYIYAYHQNSDICRFMTAFRNNRPIDDGSVYAARFSCGRACSRTDTAAQNLPARRSAHVQTPP